MTTRSPFSTVTSLTLKFPSSGVRTALWSTLTRRACRPWAEGPAAWDVEHRIRRGGRRRPSPRLIATATGRRGEVPRYGLLGRRSTALEPRKTSILLERNPSWTCVTTGLRAPRVLLNRGELAGAFGDIGTDLPLILAMVAINGLDAASTFVMFGVFQILTALRYGLPMPVQPLKAMAAIMIATGSPQGWLYGGGLVVGVVMLALVLTRSIDRIYAAIPPGVVRGIQLGLGLTLMLIAFGFILQPGLPLEEAALGYVVAFAGILVVLVLSRGTRFPPALLLIAAGIGLAVYLGIDTGTVAQGVGLSWPRFNIPSVDDIVQGGIQLAIPQIPLSIANSVVATAYLVKDYFPRREDVTPRKIAFSYSLMNLAAPFASGIPVCHGSGGLAGHHRFGARTGGSVLIYGAIFLVLGLFFGEVIFEVVKVFPFPILGVLLVFEGFALVKLVTKVADSKVDLIIALFVGAIIIGLPYGYVIGMVGGTLAYHLLRRGKILL